MLIQKMRMRNPPLEVMSAVRLVILACMLVVLAGGQEPVPVVDGDSGPCSVEFTALDGDGKPVYNAEITVHIEYGFLGLKELDLRVTTNLDGVARFRGLPEDSDGAFFFEAFTDSLRGVAVYDPDQECHGRHHIYMAKWQPESYGLASEE